METSRQVGEQGDVPFEQNIVITGQVDYVTPVASLVFDADGLVRVYDEQYDEQAWIELAAAGPADFDWFVHFRIEIISTSNEPSAVAPPALFVDAPTG